MEFNEVGWSLVWGVELRDLECLEMWYDVVKSFGELMEILDLGLVVGDVFEKVFGYLNFFFGVCEL